MLTLDRTNATQEPALYDTPPARQQPKLLDRMREAIRVKHYSLATERTYIHWAKRFIYFHGKRHPAAMGAQEVEAFLSALATELTVSASTQNQAMHALLFLYKEVLHITLPWLDNITRAKVSKRLPSVLTVSEVQALLRRLPNDGRGHWFDPSTAHQNQALTVPVQGSYGAKTAIIRPKPRCYAIVHAIAGATG